MLQTKPPLVQHPLISGLTLFPVDSKPGSRITTADDGTQRTKEPTREVIYTQTCHTSPCVPRRHDRLALVALFRLRNDRF